MRALPAYFAALFLTLWAVPALALPQLTLPAGTSGPPLDPLADSATWAGAASVSLPWDVQSAKPMGESTVVRIATDGRFLLLRFEAAQRETVVSTQRTNDVGQGTDDSVWVDVWPTGPAGFQYQFVATPNGTHYQSSTENTTYAPRWESYGAIRAGGYTVTMKIPLNVMRGAQSSGSWRVQFVRYVRATGQQAVWSYDATLTNPDDPSRAGTVSLASRTAARPRPRIATYALTRIGSEGAGGNALRSGLDLSIPVTEQTSFYATFFPDNSNVELDQQTISPTVFPRAVAEVRPFFTQGGANFNQFGCNFCNGFQALYTPAIPTPRTGYAIEGKAGAFSFTGFDAAGYGRQDLATGIVYTSADTRWLVSVNQIGVNVPGFHDDETVAGVFYSDLKHMYFYMNYGTDAGTGVTQGNRAQYYDTGVLWGSQNFSIWGGLHSIGHDFNPADAFILRSGVNGWGLFANKLWAFAPKSALSAIELGATATRNHSDSGPLNQTNNKIDLDFLTRNAIDLNVTVGSAYLLIANRMTPISQNGVSLTYHSGSQINTPTGFDYHGPSATPTKISFNTGRFGDGRLDTWIRSSTLRVGNRGTLSLQVDDTAQWFSGAPARIQWFDTLAYTYQIDRNSSLGIGLRRIVGVPPVPNGGGNCVGVCSNISLAYHARFPHSEIYVAYGDPNSLNTVPQAIFKFILYTGSDRGT